MPCRRLSAGIPGRGGPRFPAPPLVGLLLLALCALPAFGGEAGAGAAVAAAPRPLILTHYMPWYAAKPFSPAWGWHWTMNVFDPATAVDGKPRIASHFHPLIGPYDSGDPRVLEYHLLTMKLAGIDGVIVDWYGLQDLNDYAQLHRNTQRLVDLAGRFGMRVAICYEDQTIPALVAAGRLEAAKRVDHARSEIAWLAEHWFPLPNYVRLQGQPVLLSFGQTGLTDAEWSQCLADGKAPVAYFSQHWRKAAAVGAFDWPIPTEGMQAVERFHAEARGWRQAIPVAFPRFVDIYAEAKVSASYGRIEDRAGATFREALAKALESGAPLVQVATWNDWGEGTVVEPSHEFGYRDLEVLQELRRQRLDPGFQATGSDLRLPLALHHLRQTVTAAAAGPRLDAVAAKLAAGDLAQARADLEALLRKP